MQSDNVVLAFSMIFNSQIHFDTNFIEYYNIDDLTLNPRAIIGKEKTVRITKVFNSFTLSLAMRSNGVPPNLPKSHRFCTFFNCS